MHSRFSPSPRKLAVLAERAHQSRLAPTDEEAILWRALAAGRVGVAFRRQVPVAGRFIADFLAPAARVIVEVDGPDHARRRVADRRRDAVLARSGYRVLRLEAALVRRDLPEALRRIHEALARALRE